MGPKIGHVDGDKLVEWLKFHINDFGRLADSHRKMEDIRRYNECIEQQTTYEHYLRVVESGKFFLPSSPSAKESRYREALEKISKEYTEYVFLHKTADEICDFCENLSIIAEEALSTVSDEPQRDAYKEMWDGLIKWLAVTDYRNQEYGYAAVTRKMIELESQPAKEGE